MGDADGCGGAADKGYLRITVEGGANEPLVSQHHFFKTVGNGECHSASAIAVHRVLRTYKASELAPQRFSSTNPSNVSRFCHWAVSNSGRG